jgi:putative acetyltransferase
MRIELDDLSRTVVHELLGEHLQSMHALSPACSVHALDLEKLRQPNITFWTVWECSELLGCGALKELDQFHGEVKSMRTGKAHLRKGVARRVLAEIIKTARERGYTRLSLETGSGTAFQPAHRLYLSTGFALCGPFADYKEDGFSVCMTMQL